ncbi:MAG: 4Fe-4S binding protein [Clostridia bacterium]|nr:4Fe-4S binding protein [Clostridia bacterium]
MKKFFVKVKDWFVAHKPTKRRLIQLYAALLTNANLKGFFTGKIYTGDTKQMCVPGLNCYSCPGAVGACPLGALQDSLAQSKKSAPAYILGILLMFGLLLGRLICGFLCPFGLIQELLYKIRTPKLRKNRFTRVLSYFKYVLLVILIAVPLIYAGIPSFCKYVCPAGTLEGAVSLLANIQNSDFYSMLGYLFTWKFCLAVAIVVASVFIYRFFCRFICPLGAIYSLFNKISLLGVKLDKDKCIDCGLCVQGCKMDIKHVGDHECIQCGECISVCPVQAITWKGSKIFLKNTTPVDQPVVESGEKIALLELAKSNASVTVVGAQPDEVSEEGAEGAQSANIAAESELAATDGQQAAESQEAQEEAIEPVAEGADGAKKGGRLQAVKAAFKRPRFVVEFVAWVVAIAVLIGAWIGYGVRKDGGVPLVYGVGDKCPEFILQTYKSDNDSESFSTYNLSKVTVINYWYTTCDPCKAELPDFEKVFEEYDGAIDMFVVHSWSALPDGGTQGVQDFLDTETDKNGKPWNSYKLTFAQDTQELDTYAQLGGKYAYPMTVIVNADRVITFAKQGPCSEALLRENIEKALN